MTISSMIHSVTSVSLEDRSHDGCTWGVLIIRHRDYMGRAIEDQFALFPADHGTPLRVDQPDDEPDDDEPLWPQYRDTLGHTAAERQDIRDAGRGHLLP
jgi:hypothetical protein